MIKTSESQQDLSLGSQEVLKNRNLVKQKRLVYGKMITQLEKILTLSSDKKFR
jgi:hypothetical protein